MNEHRSRDSVDPDVAAGETALNWALARGSGGRVAARSFCKRRRRRQFRRFSSGVLALMALVTAGVIWRVRPLPLLASVKPPPAVALIMPPTRSLPDGSVVQLKDDAKIEVRYTSSSRNVVLHQGEAHFTVVKDASTPFVVIAGAGLEVRAVGTAFSVRLGASRVEVLVTEGRVAVDEPADAKPSSPRQPFVNVAAVRQTLATIDAGNRVVVERARATPVPAVHPVSEAEQSELLSWRVPRVELTGAPLSEVITIFNRYSPVSLSLADKYLGALKVSGVLRPNNPNALIHVLNVEYGLEAERAADGGVTLRRP